MAAGYEVLGELPGRLDVVTAYVPNRPCHAGDVVDEDDAVQ